MAHLARRFCPLLYLQHGVDQSRRYLPIDLRSLLMPLGSQHPYRLITTLRHFYPAHSQSPPAPMTNSDGLQRLHQ